MATVNGIQKRKAKTYMYTKQVHVHKLKRKIHIQMVMYK